MKISNEWFSAMKALCAVSMWLFPLSVFAVGELETTDTRSVSLGGVRALSADLLNPAQVSFTERPFIGLSVLNRFQMKELNTANLSVAFPNVWVDAGVQLATFGFSDYRLSRLQGSFSKKLSGSVAVGIQLAAVVESSILEPTDRYGISSGLGVIYRINEKVDCAVLGENLLTTLPEINRNICAGVNYHAVENVNLLTEVAYGNRTDLYFVAGMEYIVSELFALRAGYNSYTHSPSLGVGFLMHKWRIDAGFSFHSVLGLNSAIGVIYEL
ncbi:MAG: hypothetical protein LBR66_02840 [Candidatus Symbiothrix sp.]|nr:hypothetical protein [Candidatus Symbiothrix sp.]